MRLADALRIKCGDVVAFVGAGGKSSAIRVLTKELSNQHQVLITTTTKLGLEQADLAQQHLIIDSPVTIGSIIEQLQKSSSLLVTKESDAEQTKWLGLDLEEVQVLTKVAKAEGAVLIIEADGARGRSLKVPSEYEPVIPEDCDLVIPVVGLDVIGEEFPSPLVHRQEFVREHLGLIEGERILTEQVTQILGSRQGGLKDIPFSSSIRILLNKADSFEDLQHGRDIAAELIKNPEIQSIHLTSTHHEDPVHESIGRIAGVVLAAGRSSRLEGPKQFITFRGKPMVVQAIDSAQKAGLDPIVIVIGNITGEIEKVFADRPIEVVQNPQPERGQSSSIKLGLEAIRDRAEAVIFLLADMPLISSDLIKALKRKHQQSFSPVIVPISVGQRGNPVLFDQVTFDDLKTIEGDRGGRAIFDQYPIEHIEWDDSIHFDVDSEDDLSKLRELENGQ
jgi:molybdenum cofactor cytidylyltransferase